MKYDPEQKAKLEADLKKFWDAVNDRDLRQKYYWFNKMTLNRKNLGLPFLPFDPNKPYIPAGADFALQADKPIDKY